MRGQFYARYIPTHISNSQAFRAFLTDEYELGERAAARLMVPDHWNPRYRRFAQEALAV